MKRLMLLVFLGLAYLLAGCSDAYEPQPVGDAYWVCDMNGEHCECRVVGDAECPELEVR